MPASFTLGCAIGLFSRYGPADDVRKGRSTSAGGKLASSSRIRAWVPRPRITRRRHVGPSCVQRAFYPEGEDVAHVYVLHPPGGLVGGDRLELDVSVSERGFALSRPPAAQKLYRSGGANQPAAREAHGPLRGVSRMAARRKHRVPGRRRGARDRSRRSAGGGAFAGWDIGCLGRPAAGEAFENGRLRSAFRLSRGGLPLLVERFELRGGLRCSPSPGDCRGSPFSATSTSSRATSATSARSRRCCGSASRRDRASVSP